MTIGDPSWGDLGDPAGIGRRSPSRPCRPRDLRRAPALVFGDRCVLTAAIALCGGGAGLHRSSPPPPEARFGPARSDSVVETGTLARASPPGEDLRHRRAGRLTRSLTRAIDAPAGPERSTPSSPAPLNKESLGGPTQVPFVIDHTRVLGPGAGRSTSHDPLLLAGACDLFFTHAATSLPGGWRRRSPPGRAFRGLNPLCVRYLRTWGSTGRGSPWRRLNPHGGRTGALSARGDGIIAPTVAPRPRPRAPGGAPSRPDAVSHQAAQGRYGRGPCPLPRPGAHRGQDPGLFTAP
jgi:4-hydroxy-L-threonine phosphate dehydrogenase PdxA